MHAENGGLGRVDYGRSEQGAEHSTVAAKEYVNNSQIYILVQLLYTANCSVRHICNIKIQIRFRIRTLSEGRKLQYTIMCAKIFLKISINGMKPKVNRMCVL